MPYVKDMKCNCTTTSCEHLQHFRVGVSSGSDDTIIWSNTIEEVTISIPDMEQPPEKELKQQQKEEKLKKKLLKLKGLGL